MADAVKPLRRAAQALQALDVVARSGILGPYPPWRMTRVPPALRKYGLRLGGVFALGDALHGDSAAVTDERGRSSFAQMEEMTSTFAARLAEGGVGPGAGVAIMCRNHRGFLTAVGAVAKAGADSLYLNTGFSGPQLADVARREGMKALIVDQEFLEGAASLGLPIFVAWVDATPLTLGIHGTEVVSLDEVLAAGPRPAPPRPARDGRQIILTSGTTGTPKGAQRGATGEVEGLLAILSRIPLRTRDTTLIAAPMFHSWGLSNAALALFTGAHVVLARRFDPEQTLALIDKHRVTVLTAVPVMIQRIMALPPAVRRRYDTSSLRVVDLSGSALPGDLANRFMDEFGEVVYNLYGSTEVGYASIATPADLRAAPGTAGKVPLGAEVRIVDEAGRSLPRGDTGRIFVKSGLLFEGYTGGGGKEVIDGFMSTGDVGHFDRSDRLYVDGRDDDMIVSGGENVFPREVEDVLSDHAAVADAAVIGVPDAEYGQRLKAFVVLRPGASTTADDLKQHVRKHLARYKVPREVDLVEELPRNATGKVLKRELTAATAD